MSALVQPRLVCARACVEVDGRRRLNSRTASQGEIGRGAPLRQQLKPPDPLARRPLLFLRCHRSSTTCHHPRTPRPALAVCGGHSRCQDRDGIAAKRGPCRAQEFSSVQFSVRPLHEDTMPMNRSTPPRRCHTRDHRSPTSHSQRKPSALPPTALSTPTQDNSQRRRDCPAPSEHHAHTARPVR